MAKESRNKGKSGPHPKKHRVFPRRTSDKDVVVDINDFTCHHERSLSG